MEFVIFQKSSDRDRLKYNRDGRIQFEASLNFLTAVAVDSW